ncbi:hypothetical protein [Kitasatospora sp. P5_F3]
MGIRLIVEAMDTPLTLTHREARLLHVLAEDANDETGLTWSSVQDPKILRRSGLSRTQLYDVITALTEKGALEKTTAGQRGSAAKYRLTPQCSAGRDAETEPQSSAGRDPKGRFSVPLDGTQNPSPRPAGRDTVDPERVPLGGTQNPGKGPAGRDESVPLDGTPTPLLPKRDISLAPPTPGPPPPVAEEFATFWTQYPRKIQKADAQKAFAAALKAGTTAEHLTAMAIRHRAHWTAEGRQPQFVPYPASWLRKGSYDDELITPQPAGPQQPASQTYADRGIF